MEVKKLNRLKVVMAEKDLSHIWLSEQLGVSLPPTEDNEDQPL